ncbi:hypothetical protein ES703_106357 [subsurface metagenome]
MPHLLPQSPQSGIDHPGITSHHQQQVAQPGIQTPGNLFNLVYSKELGRRRLDRFNSQVIQTISDRIRGYGHQTPGTKALCQLI